MDDRELERALIAVMEKIDRLERKMNQLEETKFNTEVQTLYEIAEESRWDNK